MAIPNCLLAAAMTSDPALFTHHLSLLTPSTCHTLPQTWTQAWRRKLKKGRSEVGGRKKTKRTARAFKSIQGISIEDIQKRRAQKPEYRKAAKEASLREIKERKRTATSKDKKSKAKGPAAPKAQAFAKKPKTRGR